MSSLSITALSTIIEENTAKVENYLQSRGLPLPSFSEDGPVDFGIRSEEVAKARERAIDASLELHNLLLGPTMCLRPVMRILNLRTHTPVRYLSIHLN